MTIQIFLILLTMFATFTSLCTEGVKKFLDSLKVKYASNIVVLCVAAVVGGLGLVAYYIITGLEFTPINIVCIPIMILANWLGSMIGYDKVKQAILQVVTKKKEHK